LNDRLLCRFLSPFLYLLSRATSKSGDLRAYRGLCLLDFARLLQCRCAAFFHHPLTTSSSPLPDVILPPSFRHASPSLPYTCFTPNPLTRLIVAGVGARSPDPPSTFLPLSVLHYTRQADPFFFSFLPLPLLKVVETVVVFLCVALHSFPPVHFDFRSSDFISLLVDHLYSLFLTPFLLSVFFSS